MNQMNASSIPRRITPAKILERDDDNMILLAPLAVDIQPGPSLLALYEKGFTATEEISADPARLSQLVTSRALIMRGMRIFGMQPIPVPALRERGPDWPAGITGAISYGGGSVGVWLSREPIFAGLDLSGLNAGHAPDAARLLTPDEADVLDRLPGLQRMSPLERIAGALSAKRALGKALTPLAGKLFNSRLAQVVFSTQSGITLALSEALAPGLPSDTRFRCELRVLPDLILTWLSIPRGVSQDHPPQSGVTISTPAGGRISSIVPFANFSPSNGERAQQCLRSSNHMKLHRIHLL